MNIATVTVGDWSRDGHNMSDSFTIQFPDSLVEEDLEKFSARAEQELGFKLEDQCEGYEENSFPIKYLANVVQSAKALGVAINNDDFGYGEALYVDEETGLLSNSVWDDGAEVTYNLESESNKDSEEDGSMDSDSFVGIWLLLVNIGLKLEGRTEVVGIAKTNDKKPKEYTIGGYGLFYG